MPYAASLVSWLKFAGAHDVTGAPVASGTIEFYEVGSESVEVDCYADAGLLELLDQPIDLDAAGRATVYTTAPADIVVKDSEGATVFSAVTSTNSLDDAHIVVGQWGGVNSNLETVLGEIEDFIADAQALLPENALDSKTVATQNPSFEFDPSKTKAYYYGGYADTSATFTITWPSPAPALVQGTIYTIILHGNDVGGGATSASSVVFPSEMVLGDDAPTEILTGTVYSAQFAASTGGYIVQITPWVATPANGL